MAPSSKSHKGNKSTSIPAVSPHSVTPESKGQMDTTTKSSPVDKDARAYDHERQHLKKAADFVKTRALKKYSRPIQVVTSGTKYRGGGRVDTRKSSGFASVKAKASRFWMTEDTEDLDSMDMDDKNHYEYEYEQRGDRERVPCSNDNDNNPELASDVKVKPITDTIPDLDNQYQPPRFEVKLADLVTKGNAKAQKSKRDNGFEVIPHIRSVIVLDDTCSSNDLDMDMELLDETWEYICASDDESDNNNNNKGLSYAQIAALAK